MPTVVVNHDQPIAAALRGRDDDLDVVGVDTKSDCLAHLRDADAFVVNPASWDDEFLEGLSAGNWVQATSAGYAAFPLDAFAERGIVFSNAGGNYGPPVADHAFALLLSLARKLPQSFEHQRRREWNRGIGTDLLDLQGRTLTIAGLGNIGEEVARRARAFGMDVIGTKRDPPAYEGCLPAERVRPPGEFLDTLVGTDILVLTVPLTDETHHLIDGDALNALSDSALLVNVARGAVIDEEALVDALEADRLAGAGLDVFETEPLSQSSPLWDRDDVVITPHVGGRSQSFVSRFVDLFLRNYERWHDGADPPNRIV